METTHITSNPNNGKLGTVNEDDDDVDGYPLFLARGKCLIAQHLRSWCESQICRGRKTIVPREKLRLRFTNLSLYAEPSRCVSTTVDHYTPT